MTTMAATPIESTRPTHRLLASVGLHLVPGLAALLAYVALLPLTRAAGLPSVAALAGAGLLAAPAVQLGLIARHRRRRPDEPALALRTRLPLPRLFGWAAVEIAAAAAAFAVTAPLVRLLQTRVFGWWPTTWTIQLGTDGRYCDRALLVTAGLLFVGSVLVAPVVEELYFRGFLLPRMPSRLGRWRIPAHVGLFAGYHVWSPWLIPTRVLAILPLAAIATRTRDVRVGIVAHVLLNATDLAALLIFLRSR
jgi:membrane protease YdiL (CAAX protease family)